MSYCKKDIQESQHSIKDKKLFLTCLAILNGLTGKKINFAKINRPDDESRTIIKEINKMAKTTKESFSINGEQLLKKVKELINEGNIRKITILDKSGKELMSFPLTVGLVGAVFAPVLAAIGALAALIGECTITVEREE